MNQAYIEEPSEEYHIDIGYQNVFAHYRGEEYLDKGVADRAAAIVMSLAYLMGSGIRLESLETITGLLQELKDLGFYMVNNETKQTYDSLDGLSINC